jgi:hypothetical protein
MVLHSRHTTRLIGLWKSLCRTTFQGGSVLPKTVRPLEVARLVWKRERLNGYREPAPWKAWFERWNEEHLGHRFTSAGNFREYFFRGDAAVKSLNFECPRFSPEAPRAE